MKEGANLQRRSRLLPKLDGHGRPVKPLKRTELPRSDTPIKPMSDRRRQVNAERRPVVAEVFERDGYTCQLWEYAKRVGLLFVVRLSAGDCFGDLTPHEILSRGRASDIDANLLDADGIASLCSHHNWWVSNGDPALAEALGLLLHSWDYKSDLTPSIEGAMHGAPADPGSGGSHWPVSQTSRLAGEPFTADGGNS